MIEVFEEWTKDNDHKRKIFVRFCVNVVEMFSKYNLATTSWKEFLQDDFFKSFLYNMQNIPEDCKDCCWEKVCGGGTYGHRYNDELKTFSNKSVYCDGLKMFYKRILQYFLNSGYTRAQMAQFLSIH